MSNKSCIWNPSGGKLINQLTSYLGNIEDARIIYEMTQSKDLMKLFPNIQYDEYGDPTIESLDEAFGGLSTITNSTTSLELEKKKLGVVDEKNNSIEYTNINTLTNKVIQFNEDNPNLVASIISLPNGKYKLNLEYASIQNSTTKDYIKFNNALYNKLLNILRSMGFDVAYLENNSKYNGRFNPLDAKTTAEGLRTVIQISKGLKGEEAFPEEYSHLIIEGLHQNQLVIRLLKSLDNDEVIKAVLGNDYTGYYNEYNGNRDLLIKETAGKLLQSHIIGSPININIPTSTQNLLERLWSWVKTKIFGIVPNNTISNLINEINNTTSQLASLVQDESVTEIVDKKAIENAERLAKLTDEVNYSKDLSEKVLKKSSTRLDLLRNRRKTKAYTQKEVEFMKKLQETVEKNKYADSYYLFLQDCTRQLHYLSDMFSTIKNPAEDSSLKNISKVASLLRNTNEFIEGYFDIVQELLNIKNLQASGRVDITEKDADKIAKLATNLNVIINNMKSNYTEMRYETVFNFLKSYWGEDNIKQLGDNKIQTLALDKILEMADKDINFLDKYVSSLGDANDPLLALIDKIVKTTHSKRDARIEELNLQIRDANTILEKNGYNSSFMYERDSQGNLTGNLITILPNTDIDGNVIEGFHSIDFANFYKDRRDYYNELKKQGHKAFIIKSKIEAWERKNTAKQVITRLPNGNIKYEVLPSGKYIKSNTYNLSKIQLDYYNKMINIKAQLEDLLPNKYATTFRAVQIQDDWIEAIGKGTSPKNLFDRTKEVLKDRFIRRDDDTEFGDLADGQYRKITQDFAGNPVKRLPIYYTHRLSDMSRLSTDFTSSLLAYTTMAINYDEMSKIIDVMELTKDLVMDREVKQYSGKHPLASVYKVVNKEYKSEYTKKGSNTNIGSRIDSYFDSVLYGIKHVDEGTIGNTNVDMSKTLDALKSYSGVVGLGLNAFSAISNVTMGKLQMFYESVASEYFTLKDSAKGAKLYWKLIREYLGNINSPKNSSKLALLADKFDAMEEFNSNVANDKYRKGPFSRFIGKTNLYFMQTIGEHNLHCHTMLSMLTSDKYSIKVNGKDSTIYDALTTTELGEYSKKLIFKEGTTDNDGNLLLSKSLDDELTTLQNKQDLTTTEKKRLQELLDIKERTNTFFTNMKLKIGKVNQSMHGAFNDIDKGEIHRHSLGRLVMQFRQWMPAHYYRRFASSHYDAILEKNVEGFYRTFVKFMQGLILDIARSKKEAGLHWGSMNKSEKANVMRAFSEIGMFVTLTILASLCKGGDEDDDKNKTKLNQMLKYQLFRLKLETGASMPFNTAFPTNIWTTLRSPAAAINTSENLLKLLEFWNMKHEIESGRYKGWSEWVRDAVKAVPIINQGIKLINLDKDDYMFRMFDN